MVVREHLGRSGGERVPLVRRAHQQGLSGRHAGAWRLVHCPRLILYALGRPRRHGAQIIFCLDRVAPASTRGTRRGSLDFSAMTALDIPPINATLNGIATLLIAGGFIAIKFAKNPVVHRAFMLTA